MCDHDVEESHVAAMAVDRPTSGKAALQGGGRAVRDGHADESDVPLIVVNRTADCVEAASVGGRAIGDRDATHLNAAPCANEQPAAECAAPPSQLHVVHL